MDYSQYSKYLKDIRFWIIIFFIGRLYGITNPPLESASNWRQCDGVMIARNFYEHSNNILYPTVDVAGDRAGIVGSEFPIYNYITYLISLIFGFNDWYGRLVNLLVSSIGIFYFYKLVKKKFSQESAFYSSIILLVSLWFGYARITIPDTFAASLCIISTYYGIRYLEGGKWPGYLTFLLLGLIGCLAKISAATLFTVFAVPLLDPKILLNRKVFVALGGVLMLIGVYTWYFYWVPRLNAMSDFSTHFFMGQTLMDGIEQLIQNWPRALYHFYYTPLKYIGFFAFVFALFLIIKNKKWIPLTAFLVPFSAFFYIILVAGRNFTVNSYYPLILIPSMAFAVGYGLSLLKNQRLIYFILFAIGVEGIANQIHTFNIRYPFSAFQNLEQILDQVHCQRNDLIAINADDLHNPMPMYFAHRKGWNIPDNESLKDQGQIAYLKEHKCKYIVVLNIIFGSKVELPLEKVYESNEFIIYKL